MPHSALILGQDQLRFKNENVFIDLKHSFPFHFLSEVLTHDCVIHNKEKTDKSQKFNAKRVDSPFKFGKQD